MKKKFLVLFLTLAMVVSIATPALAAGMPGPGTIIGDGDVHDFDLPPEIIDGILPTTANLTFVIDPYNIMDLDAGQDFPSSPQTNAIRWMTADHVAPVVVAQNLSSVPMSLSVSLAVTSADDPTDPVAGATVVNTEAAVTANNNTNILLWMEPNRDNITAPTVDEAADAFVGVGYVVPMGNLTPVVLQYSLEPIDTVIRVREVHPNFELERVPDPASADRSGTAFSFGGIFNMDADWDSTAADIQIRAIFNATEFGANANVGEFVTVGTGADEIEVYGLLGDDTSLNGTDYLAAPNLIEMPDVVGGTGPSAPAADLTVTTTGTHTVARWTTTNPIRIQFPETVTGTPQVATSVANLTGNPWSSATDWSYDSTTRILTITRPPLGAAVVARIGTITITLNFSN